VTKYGDQEEVLAAYTYIRDGQGRLISIIDPDETVRHFELDLAGRIYLIDLPHVKDEDVDSFQVAYSLDDAVVEIQTPEGRVATVERDELTRPYRYTATSSDGTVQSLLSYDDADSLSLGRLWRVEDESGTTTLAYDAFGRRSVQAYQPSEFVAAELGSSPTFTATYDYGRQGHLLSVSFSGLTTQGSDGAQAVVEYPRDNMGRPLAINSVGDEGTVVLAANPLYDAQERLRYAQFGNGVTADWIYDPVHQWLEGISYRDSQGVEWSSLTYTYDENENILTEQRLQDGALLTRKVHAYCPLDRLDASLMVLPTGVQGQAYQYSAGGNLEIAGSEVYDYADQELSQAVTGISRAGTKVRTLSYDKDGQLIHDEYLDTSPSGDSVRQVRNITYDALGRIRIIEAISEDETGAVLAHTETAYVYGADGRRMLRKTEDLLTGAVARVVLFGEMAEIRVDEGTLLLRVPLTGNTIVEEARSLIDGHRLPEQSGYVHTDLRGSVIGLTSYLGPALAQTHQAEYGPWGKRLPLGVLPMPTHGFVGHEPDPHTGYYSFGHRVYDPTLRRFLTPDPLLWAAPEAGIDDGEQLNLYSYAGNNPVRMIDVSGLKADDEKKDKDKTDKEKKDKDKKDKDKTDKEKDKTKTKTKTKTRKFDLTKKEVQDWLKKRKKEIAAESKNEMDRKIQTKLAEKRAAALLGLIEDKEKFEKSRTWDKAVAEFKREEFGIRGNRLRTREDLYHKYLINVLERENVEYHNEHAKP
jgi:RHS repeat-associated protein